MKSLRQIGQQELIGRIIIFKKICKKQENHFGNIIYKDMERKELIEFLRGIKYKNKRDYLDIDGNWRYIKDNRLIMDYSQHITGKYCKWQTHMWNTAKYYSIDDKLYLDSTQARIVEKYIEDYVKLTTKPDDDRFNKLYNDVLNEINALKK